MHKRDIRGIEEGRCGDAEYQRIGSMDIWGWQEKFGRDGRLKRKNPTSSVPERSRRQFAKTKTALE